MQTKEILIHKLFHDHCSREELELLFELINSDDSENSPAVMEELFRQLGDLPKYDEVIFSRIQGKIEAETNKIATHKSLSPTSHKKVLSRKMWALGIAASVLFLLGLGWINSQMNQPRLLQEQTISGEIRHIKLPDGSSVSLNGNSSIQYAENWQSGDTRKVYLEGEAFFEVEKKPSTNAKFQVFTEGLRVEVFGTSFNVNHRNEETSVFLEEGQVKIKLAEENHKELMMKPGEIVHYSVAKKELTAPKLVSGSLESSWKTGILEFEERTIQEILSKLSEFTDIKFEIKKGKFQYEKLTISLPIHNIGVAMSILAKTSETSISQEEDTYIIQSKAL